MLVDLLCFYAKQTLRALLGKSPPAFPVSAAIYDLLQSDFPGPPRTWDPLMVRGTHTRFESLKICAIGSINSHYFHIIGDGHQPNSRGLYTHYKDSLSKVG